VGVQFIIRSEEEKKKTRSDQTTLKIGPVCSKQSDFCYVCVCVEERKKKKKVHRWSLFYFICLRDERVVGGDGKIKSIMIVTTQ